MMRVAVALPSLDPAALDRRSIDAVAPGLAARGHDVEAFSEHDRLEDDVGVPLFHYLRMPQRHAEAAFDVALYPIGRDHLPYQGVYWLMRQLPSVAWLLDASVHHLVLGGIGLMDKWAGYRSMLDDEYAELGAAVAQTVAGDWATGAVFRRYDLMRAATADQPGLLAVWPALADRLSSRLGRPVGVAPLGLAEPVAEWEQHSVAPGRLPHAAIITVNDAYAVSAVRAASRILEFGRHRRVTVRIGRPVYRAFAEPAARRLGIHDRIDWVLDASAERLAEVSKEAGLLLFLAEDLRASDRLVLLQALAAGKLVLVPDCPLYDDLPVGVVAKTDLGSALVPTLDATLHALIGGGDLREGLSAAAREFGAGYPGVEEAVAQLEVQLVAIASTCAPKQQDVGRRAWAAVAADLSDAVVPGGASAATRRHIEELLQASAGKWHPDN